METIVQTTEYKVDSKVYCDILNSVNTRVLTSQMISNKYKEVSEEISSVELNKKMARKKTLKEMMHQSFFRGAGWMGENFIA